ncbi:TetR family transcriptional regulator [Mycobacteroides abscessus subsp. abscessus]|nr:TetR family transcriptional regulator [Mycobacteroides abscessus subsp. abscessus]
MHGWAPGIGKAEAESIGALGVNALLGKRATSAVFRAPTATIADEDYIAEWTAVLATRIESLR